MHKRNAKKKGKESARTKKSPQLKTDSEQTVSLPKPTETGSKTKEIGGKKNENKSAPRIVKRSRGFIIFYKVFKYYMICEEYECDRVP